MENCLVSVYETGTEINSTIVGTYRSKIYLVKYLIKTNASWQTMLVDLTSRHSDQEEHITLQGDEKGNWKRDGKSIAEYEGCIDIDIPLTPFTNTLPIRRLNLERGREEKIKVIYLDLLEGQIKSVHQKYVRLSDTEYHYENVPNDFEAKIKVDEFGLVIDYPELFVRSDFQITKFSTG